MTFYLGQVSQYMITITPSSAPPTNVATVRTISMTAVVPAGQSGIWYGGTGSTLSATINFVLSGKPVPQSINMGETGQPGGFGGIIVAPGQKPLPPGWAFQLFALTDDYEAIVDLLRNTSPVWFSFMDPSTWSLYCDNQNVRQDQIASALTSTVALSPALVASMNAHGINLLSK
jgi:hypothetical protein